jgi:hypothetical protein
MKSHRLQLVPALLAAIAAGCTTMGTGDNCLMGRLLTRTFQPPEGDLQEA